VEVLGKSLELLVSALQCWQEGVGVKSVDQGWEKQVSRLELEEGEGPPVQPENDFPLETGEQVLEREALESD
jgi:hypothetical protein